VATAEEENYQNSRPTSALMCS